MSESNLKKDIRHFLLADGTVSGLIGSRLYPAMAEENVATPYVIYSIVSFKPTMAHDGPTGGARARVQFHIVADRVGSLEAVSTAIQDALEGLRQSIGAANTTHIGRCAVDNVIDLGVNEDTRDREKTVDFEISLHN